MAPRIFCNKMEMKMNEKLKKDVREYLTMVGITVVVLAVVLDLNTRMKPDNNRQSTHIQNKERDTTDNAAAASRDSIAMFNHVRQNNKTR